MAVHIREQIQFDRRHEKQEQVHILPDTAKLFASLSMLCYAYESV
jgi:hypothetical protein